ncbi:MAG TPA: thioesterase family protein [Arenimonas sp.]|uniref:acyl-CoA thioesterase n=1 Tax=Arenimonas sp. TaxID=1872635 RepID=UPI002D125E4B|nr:thioesterase family protein [Arenimonas sp.]HMB56060.1 thioesterase family protein [Arenimonas sp.]
MNAVVHSIVIEVRWRDLDAFNHVNNQSYLGYIEEARVRWFKSLSEDWAGESSAPILAAIAVNYRRPIGWPETLRVELFAERVGGKSVTLGHRILSAMQPELLYADGNTVLVWVNRDGQSVTLPDAVRSACAGINN